MPLIFIIICAVCGFLLATFIYSKKKSRVPLICPMGHSCDPVVHSDYAQFFGIPVEVFGALYYGLVTVSYGLILLYPSLYSGLFALVLLSLSALAFLFSLYLTSVQAFVLKEWCTWCLISAALCVAIFLLGLRFMLLG